MTLRAELESFFPFPILTLSLTENFATLSKEYSASEVTKHIILKYSARYSFHKKILVFPEIYLIKHKQLAIFSVLFKDIKTYDCTC